LSRDNSIFIPGHEILYKKKGGLSVSPWPLNENTEPSYIVFLVIIFFNFLILYYVDSRLSLMILMWFFILQKTKNKGIKIRSEVK
jgi:hypothetical protein